MIDDADAYKKRRAIAPNHGIILVDKSSVVVPAVRGVIAIARSVVALSVRRRQKHAFEAITILEWVAVWIDVSRRQVVGVPYTFAGTAERREPSEREQLREQSDGLWQSGTERCVWHSVRAGWRGEEGCVRDVGGGMRAAAC
jgi:hypothetical protein